MPWWTAIYVELFFPLVCITFLAAIRWGASSEIAVAFAYLVATDSQKIAEGSGARMFAHFEGTVAVIDVALFVALLLVALQNQKKWMICCAALQLLSLFAHFGKLTDQAMSPLAYAILMGSGGYPSQILLSIGIGSRIAHARRASV